MTQSYPLTVQKAIRYKKACPVDEYLYPPRHLEKSRFKRKLFLTESQIRRLARERLIYGFSHHGKTYLTVNPYAKWEWSSDEIKMFWTPI